MNDNITNENKISKIKDNGLFNFLVFRTIFIVLLILTITAIKFLDNKTFEKFNSLYKENIAVNITADYFNNAGE